MKLNKIIFKTFVLFLHVIIACNSLAQTINGTITSDKGTPVNRVTCRLISSADSILAYTFTDSKGEYSLKYVNGGIYLTFSKVGYNQERMTLKTGQKTYNVKLSQGEIKLKEVTVTAPPIIQHKDTLLYNVASFKQKGDLYIEDVLKRLPGIDVDANGQITYQGVAINQVNIEGQNLMGNQYNLATQNMPAEAVAQVQVMQNNQPIRSLAGKVNTNRATLNLKLKKAYNFRPFGELIGSYGTAGIYDEHITTIAINKKNQFLMSAGMNNQGNNYAQIVNGVSTANSLYTNEALPKLFLQNTNEHTPPLTPEYYLKNKSYYASVHYLHGFSDYSTLRINALWYHDGTNRNDSAYNQYIAKDTTIVSEAKSNHYQTNVVKGQIQYELNTEKVFLQDEMSGKLNAGHTNENIDTEYGKILERIKRRPFTLQNILSMNINTGSRLIQLSSLVRHYSSNEQLYAIPDSIDNKIRLNQFFMRNRIGTSFNVFGNPLLISYIVEYKHNNVDFSDDCQEEPVGSKSISHYWLHTFEPVYEWNFTGGSVEFRLPLEWIGYRYEWKNQTNARWMFSPSVTFEKKLSPKLTISANVGLNQDANTDDIPVRNTIANNYRNFTEMCDSLSVERMDMAAVRLSYLNTVSLWSWSIYTMWSRNKSDFYTSTLYLPELTFSLPVWKENHRYNRSIAYNIKKNFRCSGITFVHNMSYAYNKFLLSQNGTEDYINTNALNLAFSVYWDKLSWLHVKLNSSGNISWKGKDSFSYSHNYLKNFYSSLHADVYPISLLRLYVDCSVESFEITHGNYSSNYFSNVGCEWNILKRLSLSAVCYNLLNRRSYEETSFSGTNYHYYSMPLCPREFIMSCRQMF